MASDIKFIIWILASVLVLVMLYNYVKHLMRTFRRFRYLLLHDVSHPERHAREVIADIKNKPVSVTWSVTCNGHKTGRSYCRQEYEVTHPWPSDSGSWRVISATMSCPSTIFEEPYVRLTASVKVTNAFNDFPPELKQIEQEIRHQHSECDIFKFYLTRQTESVYHKFIVKEGHSTKWIPLRHWLSNIFLCLCSRCNSFVDHKVHYTIEKLYTASAVNQNQSESTAANQQRDELPPSYQDVQGDIEQYQPQRHQVSQNGTIGNHSNLSNYGNVDVSVDLPSYEEYTRNIDQLPTLHSIPQNVPQYCHISINDRPSEV